MNRLRALPDVDKDRACCWPLGWRRQHAGVPADLWAAVRLEEHGAEALLVRTGLWAGSQGVLSKP
jgi:hypothetical protein